MMLANAVLARQVLRSVDRVVFISETTSEYFGKVNYVHRPLLLFNGVDTKVFNISTSELGSFKRKFGLAADRSSALFVGRFIERKGVDYFRDLATLYPHIDWLFAGWGPIDPETWNRANVKGLPQLERGRARRPLSRVRGLCPSKHRRGFPSCHPGGPSLRTAGHLRIGNRPGRSRRDALLARRRS